MFSDTSKALLQFQRHMQGISHCVLVQQNPFSSLNSILLSLCWPTHCSPRLFHVCFYILLPLIERFGVMMKLPCYQTNSSAVAHSSSERLEIHKQDLKGAGRGRGNGRFVFQGG